MKIVHMCLSCFYNEGYAYQENILPRMHAEDGHEVLVIASTEVYVDNLKYGFVEPTDYFSDGGFRVIRVPYSRALPQRLARALRLYVGVNSALEEFCPDLIFFHGVGGHGMVDVANYMKCNPEVRLLMDCHASLQNSGNSFLSRQILHKTINRKWVTQVMPYVEKVLSITYEGFDFLEEMYGLRRDEIGFFPLGGIVKSEDERLLDRQLWRKRMGLQDEVVFVHSGKLEPGKKTTSLLDAMRNVSSEAARLVIAGSAEGDVLMAIEEAVEVDDRIIYLGWLPADQLEGLLHAADVYMQPGTCSATLQMALCAGCLCAVDFNIESYKLQFGSVAENISDPSDIASFMEQMCADRRLLGQRREESFALAKEQLDYKAIARNILA